MSKMCFESSSTGFDKLVPAAALQVYCDQTDDSSAECADFATTPPPEICT